MEGIHTEIEKDSNYLLNPNHVKSDLKHLVKASKDFSSNRYLSIFNFNYQLFFFLPPIHAIHCNSFNARKFQKFIGV